MKGTGVDRQAASREKARTKQRSKKQRRRAETAIQAKTFASLLGKDEPADTEFKNRRWSETEKASVRRRDTALIEFAELAKERLEKEVEEEEAEAAEALAEGPPAAPRKNRVRRVRKREKPSPSSVWQTVAIVFLGFAFATGVSALTVADDVGVSVSELWVSTVALTFLGSICLFSHWDSNRGRRVREYEVEEEVDDID